MTKDRGEHDGRIRALQRALADREIGAALIFQNVDLFYYTATIQDGVLLVPREGEPVLFIRRSLERGREESAVDHVVGLRKLAEIAEYLEDNRLPCSVIGLEMDVLPSQIFLDLQSMLPDTRFQDVSVLIRGQRAVKSPREIGFMKEAGRRLDIIWERTPSLIRPGRTEYDVYRDFCQLLLEQQSSPLIRARTFNMELEQRILLSGDSTYKLSAMDSPTAAGDGLYRAFPYGAGMKKIRRHETFLIDMVFIYQGYMVDCTRVFATGRIDEKLSRAHAVSADCHALFLEKVTSSASVADIHDSVWRYVSERDLGDVFMGGVRFIGHGVGLEIDEFPVLTGRWKGGIEPGMTIAFEPKFVFPEGTVGYENTYYIEEGRAVSLDRGEESIVTV